MISSSVFSAAFVGIIAAFLVIVVSGVAYQQLGLARDARRFPPPGQLIDIGGIKLHVDVVGKGSPPVVFEAGIAATSLSWRLIQSEIAKTNQTISYDRAGLGWSDASVKPRNLDQLVDALRVMLDRAGIAKPRVLVAHSFGGLIAATYASRYPQELEGLVLVDPVGADEWSNPTPRSRAMLARGIFMARCGRVLAQIGLVRFALAMLSGGARTTPKLIARASSGRSGAAFTERIVGQIRKLPPEIWPMIQSHWCDPKSFRSMAIHLASLPACAAAFLSGVRAIDTPFILLSADDVSPAQRASQEKLVQESKHGRLEIVANSGHWIQLDRPDAVIAAIKRMSMIPRS